MEGALQMERCLHLYSRTCLERLPVVLKMWSLKTGGLWWQVQLHWHVGPSARNACSFKTGGLSQEWSLKAGFTVYWNVRAVSMMAGLKMEGMFEGRGSYIAETTEYSHCTCIEIWILVSTRYWYSLRTFMSVTKKIGHSIKILITL